ncbi:MAG: 50S ribosomal protein L33, partial [Candidatus Eremiobacteraeota bacterium]|nr:50S ribosomal protein L33 [Candidatus Eremiobacteraeota bacterium]
MAKKENRVMVVMACTNCKRRNYNTQKNKQKTTARLEL